MSRKPDSSQLSALSRRYFIAGSAAAGAGLALTGSTAEPSPTDGTGDQDEDGTIDGEGQRVTIAALSQASSLDPGLAVDTETERILRQIFETLVSIDSETGAVAPQLAESWDVSTNGRTYTFELRRDVTFHDGTALDAEVVVANLERAGRLDELYGSGNISGSIPLAFPSVFGGFLSGEDCMVDTIEATGEHTVELTLHEPISFLLQALTLPAFGIASAEVLSDSDPGLVARSPIGSGPYRLAAGQDDSSDIHLQAYRDHWQEHTGPEEVTVRALPRSFDRLRELNRGEVDVYDGITADNLRSLVQAGRMILQRDPFSILYLGFNLDHPVMAEADIREAAARAVDRNSLVENLFLDGSRPAYQFTPPALGVQSEAATRYAYDLTEARDMLEDSSYDGEPLTFYYPIRTTRSYLPRPEAVYAAVAANLTAAGFQIRPKPVVWDEGYVDQLLQDDDRALHLLGRNGGYRSPHSFLSPLFGSTTQEFRYSNSDVVDLLAEARGEEDEDTRIPLYQEAAELIAEDLPALPLAFPISGLALGSRVADYPMSPVLNERFRDISLSAGP